MSMQTLENAIRPSRAVRLAKKLLTPEVIVLVLLFALSLVLTLKYPEAVAELSILG